MRRYQKSVVISILIGTLGGLTAIGMFALSGLMLSKSAFNVPLYTLTILVATIKLFGVIRAVTRYFERLISHEATFDYLKHLRVSVVTRLMDDFVNLSSRYKMSELLKHTINNIEKMQNIILRVIYPPLVVLLTSIIVVIGFSFYDLGSAVIITFVMLLILLVIPVLVSRWMKHLTLVSEQSEARYQALLVDYHRGYNDILVFDDKHRFKARLEAAQLKYEQSKKREKGAIIIYDFILNTLSMAAILGVLLTYNGPSMFYASIVMVTITLFEMAVPMTNVPFYLQETRRARKNLDEINMKQMTEGIKVSPLPIELSDLSFSYQDTTVLNHINLKIEPGQKIAIVGESGSGKSTLLKLIAGLHDSEMVVDHTPFNQIDKSHHFSQLNVMMQQNHFIEGTVLENMFTDDRVAVRELLHRYHLTLDVDQYITQFGEMLSGGEKKRLHFIRMCLRQNHFWLLDEPFNGVDENNKQIMLNDLLGDTSRTVVMISHELNILKQFDLILLMQNGTIIEKGSYNDLMTLKGEFYRRQQLEQDQVYRMERSMI